MMLAGSNKFNKIVIQSKRSDGKWTRKPLTYRESNDYPYMYEIHVNCFLNIVMVILHLHKQLIICSIHLRFSVNAL